MARKTTEFVSDLNIVNGWHTEISNTADICYRWYLSPWLWARFIGLHLNMAATDWNSNHSSALMCNTTSWNCSRCPRDKGSTIQVERFGGLPLVCPDQIWTPEVTQRIVTLALIMLLTLVGNIIIIIVLTCSKYRKLNSRVNIFIINLAVGDLSVCCLTMTTEVLFDIFEKAWVLGPAACKILLYIQIVTLASTTFILTSMSYDRYVAICRPLRLGSTGNRARRMLIVSWLLAFLLAVPQLFIFKQVAGGVYPDGEIKYKCKSVGYTAWWQRKLYFTFMTSYILILPTLIISFCYINVVRVVFRQGKELSDKNGMGLRRTIKDKSTVPRAKIKTVKMTLSIICSFICCWTPYFVVHLIHIWSEYTYDIPEPVYVFAETIALLNSGINPILYGCFNIKLKRGLFEVFCPSRLPAGSKANRTGVVTECVTFGNEYACSDVAKRLSNRCIREPTSSSSAGSSHTHPQGESRDGDVCRTQTFIKEENKNGFRLRVRFVPEGSKSGLSSDVESSLLAADSDAEGAGQCRQSNTLTTAL